MKVKTLEVLWHSRQPVFSIDFNQNCSNAKFATCGADSTIRIWKVVKKENENPSIEFLSELDRHAAAVNCVRWSPKDDLLASTGDDGTIFIWQQSTAPIASTSLTQDSSSDQQESWRVIKTLRGNGSEFYDLSWSPDAKYIVVGSIDNTARVYDVETCKCINVLTEHTHYVQGVTWDPLGKYVATQSSDRSVNIYPYELSTKADSPLLFKAPVKQVKYSGKSKAAKKAKQIPSVIPTDKRMLPPLTSSASSPSIVTSATPAPKPMSTITDTPATSTSPTTAVNSAVAKSGTPIDIDISINDERNNKTAVSPVIGTPQVALTVNATSSLKRKATTSTSSSFRMYQDEDLISFFRRLQFSPDGSLLLTPAGIFSNDILNKANVSSEVVSSSNSGLLNCVWGYTRGSLKGKPVFNLPGFKKPAISIRFSPVAYKSTSSNPYIGLKDYKFIYAVTTQDSCLIYDTSQVSPICLVGNLHYSGLTDMSWSADGCTLMFSSTDGHCSMISFDENELGTPVDADKVPVGMRNYPGFMINESPKKEVIKKEDEKTAKEESIIIKDDKNVLIESEPVITNLIDEENKKVMIEAGDNNENKEKDVVMKDVFDPASVAEKVFVKKRVQPNFLRPL